MDRPGLSRTLLRGQLLTDWRVILHDQLTMIVIIIIIQKSAFVIRRYACDVSDTYSYRNAYCFNQL